eukprot:3641677-Prymnesium_polylepis.2
MGGCGSRSSYAYANHNKARSAASCGSRAPKFAQRSLLAEAWDERVMQICGCDYCWDLGERSAPVALRNPWLGVCDDCEESEDETHGTDSGAYIAADAPEHPAASDACQAAELEDWVVV